MEDIDKFIPRGFMCCNCKYALDKCNHLEFHKMKVIGKFKDGYKEVKCNNFEEKGNGQ